MKMLIEIVKLATALAAGACLIAAGIVTLSEWWQSRHAQRHALTPLRDEEQADFQEFYLDLHRSATTVDYSLEEARGLYQTWQRRERVTSE